MAKRLGQPLPSGEKVSTAASTSPIPSLTTVAEIAALADPVARLKELPALNSAVVRAVGSDLLTIRVDLD